MIQPSNTKKSPGARGFTIVELLIVIVVIAILAAISVVAYNGVQDRSRNSHTRSVVASWVKALEMYRVDHGKYPDAYDSCLGEASAYPWDFAGSSSGSNQCRYAASSYYTVMKSNLVTTMKPYFNGGSLPTPDVSTIGTSANWARGAVYSVSSPTAEGRPLAVSYVSHGDGSCSSVSGLALLSSISYSGGKFCTLRLGFNPL